MSRSFKSGAAERRRVGPGVPRPGLNRTGSETHDLKEFCHVVSFKSFHVKPLDASHSHNVWTLESEAGVICNRSQVDENSLLSSTLFS